MPGVRDLLAEYAALAPDMRTKGFYFERLIQNFLREDPQYAAHLSDVWLWSEWPGRDGRPDTGIDLVAKLRYADGLVAIQCKFYDAAHTVQKADIDSFFTASGKAGFAERLIVTTTDKWGSNATEALRGQQIPTARISLADLEASEIDWSTYSLLKGEQPELLARKKPRDHQKAALSDVIDGLEQQDRGQLIMACGTGKTFTSLKIAERVVPRGGSVLFLVPSIALLSQSLREWSAQAEDPIRAFAICSDTKVGKDAEDLTLTDLSFPATTDAAKLVAQSSSAANPGGLTVYFSTYQSIDVIAQAQAAGLPDFDLVICDEAHRTTGVTLSDDAAESHFVRVHDAGYIRAAKRLYMTATPKIYGDAVKSKAKNVAAELASMDDETKFGPVLHRLGFGDAVQQELLTDYRVLVLAVNESAVSVEFQQQFANDHELGLNDAARIAGIYQAFSKRAVEGLDEWKPAQRDPMRRAVAFSRSIKDSEAVQRMLDRNAALAPSFFDGVDSPLVMRAQHVDGGMNVMTRTRKLDWLKAEPDGNEVRILTNARCLSEGVDVPSLDAVVFLNSRDSLVDVVQSVGRVMRRAPGKDYGYIILPIAIEAGVDPAKALDDNKKYKVVWDVLRALRAHDERFEAKIESLDLNRTKHDDQIQVIAVDGPNAGDGDEQPAGLQSTQQELGGINWGDRVREAVYAKLVTKVGEREYWENWAASVAEVAAAQTLRIKGLLDHLPEVRAEFDRFVKGLQDNLNPSVTPDQALEMLAQHLITQPVLEALFEGAGFASHNPVALAMNRMLEVLEGQNLASETKDLERFYDSVRQRVTQIKDARGKQEFLKLLYQRFFAVAMKKASERLGIVYTPTEIVDYILRSVDWILREQFDTSISAEGVHVLDPFTGTGTFIAELIHSDLISDADLPRKFRHELHANEINLLAYYVAAVNIEEAYQSRMGGEPVAFPGIVLTDTFQMTEADDANELAGLEVFPENNAAVERQKRAPISVVVGNPPYSVGQSSGNDDNQNLKYPTLDAKIRSTYAARSTAKNKNNLYDSYIRAIRWASDRIGERGVVAFVTNGGFLDSNTADGLRKVLADEFSDLFILNLRGNARTAGEPRRKEAGNVFGNGGRTTIAIGLFARNPDNAGGGLHYRDVGDYLSREQKLATLRTSRSAATTSWTNSVPNAEGDWISQRNEEFDAYMPLGDKANPKAVRFFGLYGAGLQTNRDSWVYSSSCAGLEYNVGRIIANYNSEIERWVAAGRPPDVESFIDLDATRISWSRSLRQSLAREAPAVYDSSAVRPSMYRPFERRAVYFDRLLNHERSQLPRMFPMPASENLGFYSPGHGSGHPFSVLMTDVIPDVALWGSAAGYYYPRYTYERPVSPRGMPPAMFGSDEFAHVDNVTDGMLAEYRKHHGPEVTKDDIFFYVYGILHSSEYRERFAADLKKMLPRIPNVADFWGFSKAGRALSELHLGYETLEPWPFEAVLDGVSTGATTPHYSADLPETALRVTKMRYRSKTDKSAVVVNERLTLSGIPPEAHEYLLGSRSALDWILERYQIKTDKASGIVNDPNAWGEEHGDPRYIVDLVGRITRVSVETVAIVKALPPLEILAAQ